MKQTIEIEVPDGKKAVWKDNKVVFEDIKPRLPKTWEEFCDIRRDFIFYFIDEMSYIKRSCKRRAFRNKGIDSHNKIFLPSEDAAKTHLALMQLHQLRDCYRQGWEPDWFDEERKFFISYWDNKILQVFSSYQVPHFLSFQTEELAKKFLNNFRELIEQAGDLI